MLLILTTLCLVTAICDAQNITQNFENLTTVPENHNDSKTLLRVRHGYEVSEGMYPYVVIVLNVCYPKETFRRRCTATLISEIWTLTAAQCISDKEELEKKGIKTSIWFDKFTENPVRTLLFMPVLKFVLLGKALSLVLTSKIRRKEYGVPSKVVHTDLYQKVATYVGAGMTAREYDDSMALSPLRYAEGIIIKCEKNMTEICLAPTSADPCSRPAGGDVGAPLIYDGMIIGTFSFTDNTKKILFTPIKPYLYYIETTLNHTAPASPTK